MDKLPPEIATAVEAKMAAALAHTAANETWKAAAKVAADAKAVADDAFSRSVEASVDLCNAVPPEEIPTPTEPPPVPIRKPPEEPPMPTLPEPPLPAGRPDLPWVRRHVPPPVPDLPAGSREWWTTSRHRDGRQETLLWDSADLARGWLRSVGRHDGQVVRIAGRYETETTKDGLLRLKLMPLPVFGRKLPKKQAKRREEEAE